MTDDDFQSELKVRGGLFQQPLWTLLIIPEVE